MTMKPSSVKSLRRSLIQLVLVAVLPLVLFACTLIYYVSYQENKELENTLSSRAQSVQSLIDDQLSAVLSSLQILALTEDFNPEDFPSIHKKFSKMIRNLDGWESIAVADLDGKLLIHTAQPFGSDSFAVGDQQFFKEVLSTGKPAFSNLRFSKNLNKNVFTIAIPIRKMNRTSLILYGNISNTLITQTLKSTGLTKEWYATVLGRDNVIIARSRKAKEFVGTKISDDYHKLIKSNVGGVLKADNKEGVPSLSVFTKSPVTNWIFIVGVPASNLAIYSNLTLIVFLLGALLIILGIVLAMRVGSKISGPIDALSRSAIAFGEGSIPEVVVSSVKEVNILAKSIQLASLQRISSESAIRTLHEISSSLSGELDLKKLLQSFIDQTTLLTRAQYGAYLHTPQTENDLIDVVTHSGSPADFLSLSPLPINKKIFAPAFEGTSLVRIEDVTSDPRYMQDPESQSHMRSFLAVPVISHTGVILGVVFFAHSDTGVFTDQDEKLMGSLAAQAATAIDNASLYSEATQAVELRDTFLSVASHELKTPLTALYLQFDLLKRTIFKTTGDNEKIGAQIDRFQSHLSRITRLINELLDVTRIASGKMDLQLERVNLETLVREICTNFENEAVQNGSPISLKFSDSATGLWDPSRIEQVVTNIISNAVKYGGKKPIEVTTSKDDQWAYLKIKDQGLGIATEDQVRIFDRFERAIDTKAISGLGLGLFICKEIILRHGGDILVQSHLGQGSVFTIKLPLIVPGDHKSIL